MRREPKLHQQEPDTGTHRNQKRLRTRTLTTVGLASLILLTGIITGIATIWLAAITIATIGLIGLYTYDYCRPNRGGYIEPNETNPIIVPNVRGSQPQGRFH